uniref:Uncharacterized protein n=2 Tax=Aegilops tauschii subsp. strangulata TaxID=200361 RepID=A0A452YDW2_AEGTS
ALLLYERKEKGERRGPKSWGGGMRKQNKKTYPSRIRSSGGQTTLQSFLVKPRWRRIFSSSEICSILDLNPCLRFLDPPESPMGNQIPTRR